MRQVRMLFFCGEGTGCGLGWILIELGCIGSGLLIDCVFGVGFVGGLGVISLGWVRWVPLCCGEGGGLDCVIVHLSHGLIHGVALVVLEFVSRCI